MADHLPPRSSAVAPPAAEPAGSDWPAQLTGLIVRAVEQVREKTTRPATTVVRAIVYGLIAAVLGIALASLLFIGLFRAADVLRNLVVEDAVWLTYVVLGVLFTAVGAFLFRLRKPSS
jgi:H+/Cl- antiporter ClcA